jgi:hypothetical protein
MTIFKNYQILPNEIIHRFLATTKLFSGERASFSYLREGTPEKVYTFHALVLQHIARQAPISCNFFKNLSAFDIF